MLNGLSSDQARLLNWPVETILSSTYLEKVYDRFVFKVLILPHNFNHVSTYYYCIYMGSGELNQVGLQPACSATETAKSDVNVISIVNKKGADQNELMHRLFVNTFSHDLAHVTL